MVDTIQNAYLTDSGVVAGRSIMWQEQCWSEMGTGTIILHNISQFQKPPKCMWRKHLGRIESTQKMDPPWLWFQIQVMYVKRWRKFPNLCESPCFYLFILFYLWMLAKHTSIVCIYNWRLAIKPELSSNSSEEREGEGETVFRFRLGERENPLQYLQYQWWVRVKREVGSNGSSLIHEGEEEESDR